MADTLDSRHGTARKIWRWLLAIFYFVAGVLHLASPAPFIAITPHWVPAIPLVIALTGMCEIAGAAALVQARDARLRRAGGIGLAVYAVCVFPANINHMMIDLASGHGLAGHGLGLAYHAPRMVLQPLLVWVALWVGGVVDWPWAGRAPQD